MTLPFKLLSQPTADTTAQTQKDTRALASGEALQRLKTSGALDVQKQKGRDQLRTTLAPFGIDPTSANYASNLDVLRQGLNALRMGQGVEAFSKGGVRIPEGQAFDANTGIMPSVVPGYDLPGEAANRAIRPQVKAEEVEDVEYFRVPGTKGRAGTIEKVKEKKKITTQQKGGAKVQRLTDKHIGIISRKFNIPSDKIVGIVVNPRVGDTEHKGTFVQYEDANGKPRARKLSPQDIANMGAAQ